MEVQYDVVYQIVILSDEKIMVNLRGDNEIKFTTCYVSIVALRIRQRIKQR